MKLNKRWIGVGCVLFLLILLTIMKDTQPSPSLAIQSGSIDLRNWHFQQQGNIQLDGTWAFYWKEFVTFENLQNHPPDIYVDVPKNWNKYKIDNQFLPAQGYATYRLHVKTSLPKNSQLGLMMNKFSSAYRLYINDVLVTSNGIVAKEAANEIGQYKPQAVTFNIPAQEFDIIIHVSNFQFSKGGFGKAITLGESEDILNTQYFITGKELFLQGMLIIIAILFLAIYLFQRQFKYSLYFACMTLVGMIALDTVSEIIISRIFPDLSLHYIILIWYSTSHWVVFFLILYFNEIFKTAFSKYVVSSAFVVYSIIQLMYLTTNPIFYSQYATILNVIDIIFFGCVLLNIALGIKKRERDSWIHGISLFIFVFSYIHDILYWNHYIHHQFGEMIYIGSFTFHFIQIVIQARRIQFFFKDKQRAELAFLQSQIRPHFLFNTLNTFIAISRTDLDKAHRLLYDLVHYLRNHFDIQTLSEFSTLRDELHAVTLYTNIQKVRFEDKFDVHYQLPDSILDTKTPILILQPIVENALIHGILPKDGAGVITISVEEHEEHIHFIVEDNGAGIDVQKEPIHGIALSNIDDRLRKLYKKGLVIDSVPGKGTKISWIIPQKGR